MNQELQGFGILIWLRQFMKLEINPVSDFQLADLPTEPAQITEAFKMPWVKRVIANGQTWNRAEWAAERAKSNGNQVDLMK